ncbi:uncharacterized protein SPAPADRAFT_52778 [Spathaspora passalidarum NRRL Y-27907]|uniref:WW domain-containing protein n=1 Tax=Spathaspora passalidarum (strain NRRL Y-27907 / 11-Y1) TaxID=619300 RepID=G3AVH8_SPAPN|nr:uncharacterized protein SPAPADRAFT_52778 [Spathaspora passalidarum NRRL Y-27907]EGW29927.1 hypothetical protein SPAPADRAFT_52778 [Spathaspora passalidarum NRRL Y-27907]
MTPTTASSATAVPSGVNPWKLVYDETLQQYYYLNIYENTISFDTPCEVNYKPKRHFSLPGLIKRKSSSSHSYCYSKPSLFRRISNTLSIKSNKSNEQVSNKSNDQITTSTSNTLTDGITGIDEEYFISNDAANFKNFAGTSSIMSDYSIDSELEEPISDEESNEIHSYYADIYQEEETFVDSIDRERELRELRLQMLKELY